MQKKRWIIKNKQNINNVNDALGVDSIIKNILYNRGIADEESIDKFLEPDIKKLYDPFLLPDMKEAINLIKKHIDAKGKIIIYGDYDADGITSSSILYRCFKKLKADIGFYIPSRIDEGYGLNIDAIKDIVDKGASLIITVDCGVTALDEAFYCKQKGVDIIITDHHECSEILPDALVINPKRQDSLYPFKYLAGVGVAFKLIQALASIFDLNIMDYIDLTCIGTVADIVPLLDENRIIVKYGIEAIKNTRNYGIQALLKCAEIDRDKLNTTHISFFMAPRINAIGRISDANIGVELFINDSIEKSMEIAAKLNDENKRRQQIEEAIFIEGEKLISDTYDDKDYVIVLQSDCWHMGVVGIVASRIVEKYYRPTILLNKEGKLYRGSARSIQGFNLYEALCECSDLLLKFGGHDMAAGLTLENGNLALFKEKINEIARRKILKKDLIPFINIDWELNQNDLNYELANKLELLEPFGVGNPAPVFAYKETRIHDIRTVGDKDKHLKIRLKDNKNTIDGIAFNLGHTIDEFSKNNCIDLVCEFGKNTWNGRESLQFVVKDMRKSPFKTIEENFYRSLKPVIDKMDKYKYDEIEVLTDYIIDLSLDDLMEKISNEKSLIIVNNVNILKYLLDNYSHCELLFDNDSLIINDTVILANGDLSSINAKAFHGIYILDNIFDWDFVLHEWFDNEDGINFYIVCKDVVHDVEFIESLEPSRDKLEYLFSYIKKSINRRRDKQSVETISKALSMNILSVYYCLKVLNELGTISIAALKDGFMAFRVNKELETDLSLSATIKKFDTIKENINNLKYIYQMARGYNSEY
ncbi:single-stranded-DNA-specific exonuclease RecJ [Oxobacter pfennigii]|uniref:Single-stranded-DNA-specific exonuclease RecJ n=1 Tax=Oxobacter pfennigii TaxID=36849 RepID=A0A0P8X2E9_9CLOT|nr:single-stranded-DNA-specific exonuclease RecJ [Oxobacter pfennigii]KPU44987.1 single-stranded-DNA-specific exonuclease RecJ [Oxobacter pfennigii]